MKVYRIVKPAYATARAAFGGEGGLSFPGRWHARGHRIVYTSGSLALALLETMVHVPSPRSLRGHVWFTLDIDDALLETPDLPAGWDDTPPAASVRFGTDWLRSGRSLALRVQSVLAPEANYLINPAHPACDPANAAGPFPLKWDARLG